MAGPLIQSSSVAVAAIGAAALALVALGALHALRPDLDPSRTMISQYARGPYGWGMCICFAAFAAATALLSGVLIVQTSSLLGRVGAGFLLAAAIGFAAAAFFPMDPVSTPPAQMSFSGKMHMSSFFLTLPAMLLAVMLLSAALSKPASHASLPLWGLAIAMCLSFAAIVAIMLAVGPGKPPDPDGLERFLGWPNRLLIAAYGVWLMLAAWPLAH